MAKLQVSLKHDIVERNKGRRTRAKLSIDRPIVRLDKQGRKWRAYNDFQRTTGLIIERTGDTVERDVVIRRGFF